MAFNPVLDKRAKRKKDQAILEEREKRFKGARPRKPASNTRAGLKESLREIDRQLRGVGSANLPRNQRNQLASLERNIEAKLKKVSRRPRRGQGSKQRAGR